MLQIQDLLLAAIAAFMPSDSLAFMPQFHRVSVDARLYCGPGRSGTEYRFVLTRTERSPSTVGKLISARSKGSDTSESKCDCSTSIAAPTVSARPARIRL